MACALTQGYSQGCRDSAGGIKSVYLIEFDNVSGITQSAGTATVISKANGGRFWKYVLQRSTGEWMEEYQDSIDNGTTFQKQTLTFPLNGLSAATSQEIKLLAQNKLIAVVESQEPTPKYWLLGETNGLMREGGKSGSGKAFGDRSGYELTFTGEESRMAIQVSSGIIAGLIVP
jgi:hypothetical protein